MVIGFPVLAKRCDECLYSPDRIVGKKRFAELQKELRNNDDYFVCHKATIKGVSACCRGDWDVRGGGQLGRIAERLGVVGFVDEAKLNKLPHRKEDADV